MFNFNLITFICFWFFFYTVQTLVFVTWVMVFKSKIRNTLNIFNTNYKYVVYTLIMSYAGLPPFFMFFFKIAVLLNLQASYWVLLLYILVNTALLFYYINFLLKLQHTNDYTHTPLKIKNMGFLVHVTLYLIFVNLFGFFFLEYLNFVF